MAEKYATDYKWYVDVILNLIRLAGDYVSEEVWYRVIQIVINREDVQGQIRARVYVLFINRPPITHTLWQNFCQFKIQLTADIQMRIYLVSFIFFSSGKISFVQILKNSFKLHSGTRNAAATLIRKFILNKNVLISWVFLIFFTFDFGCTYFPLDKNSNKTGLFIFPFTNILPKISVSLIKLKIESLKCCLSK